MTPDDVITLRRTWAQYDYGEQPFPVATVLATTDWLAYVSAMAGAISDGPAIEYPTEAEVRWAWPDGVVIVFDHPIDVEHIQLSHTGGDGAIVQDEPHYVYQPLRAIVIGPETSVRPTSVNGQTVVYPDGTPVVMIARSARYIDEDPGVYYGGWISFGGGRRAVGNLDRVGGVARLMLSIITALGHRLTTSSAPSGSRAERRRIERELPGLRVIDLASGATTESRGGTVEWSHRWMVRGHWRDQACGPGWSQRKLTWVDPHIKGPAHLPLDVRPTIWKTEP